MTNIRIGYQLGAPNYQMLFDPDQVFGNTGPYSCPIISCILKISDCSSDYSSLTNDISLEGSPSTGVSVSRIKPAGFHEDLCLSCTDGTVVGIITSWSIS